MLFHGKELAVENAAYSRLQTDISVRRSLLIDNFVLSQSSFILNHTY